jgi:hypothetical protein
MKSNHSRIVLHAQIDKDYLYEVGKLNGLSEEALKMFIHFNEIPVTVEVDRETGEVTDWYRPSYSRIY